MRQSKFGNPKYLQTCKPSPIQPPIPTTLTVKSVTNSLNAYGSFGTLQMQEFFQPNPRAYGYKTTAPTATVLKQEGNNPMYINNTLPIDVQQKTYLNERARTVFFNLQEKLNKQFFIYDDETPKTLADLKDRIANNLFVIRNDDGDKINGADWDDEEDSVDYSILSSIRWRDPAKKADGKGNEIAHKELEAKFTATKDQIMIGVPADGLKALQDLEAWVPSNLPS